MRRRTGAPSLIEGLAKRYDWRSIALVGISDHLVLSRILGTATRVRVTVVAQPVADGGLRDSGLWTRIKGLCASYSSRAELIEAKPSHVPDDGAEFDAVYLANCEAASLYEVGGAWLPRVRTGGMQIGDGARDLKVRAILKAVAPSRELLADGMWIVRVRRSEPPLVAGGEEAGAGAEQITVARGLDETDAIGHAIAPDPVDAGANEHETVAQVEAPEPGTGAEGEVFVADDVVPPQPKRSGRPKGSRTKKASVS